MAHERAAACSNATVARAAMTLGLAPQVLRGADATRRGTARSMRRNPPQPLSPPVSLVPTARAMAKKKAKAAKPAAKK